MNDTHTALSTPGDIEALADALSGCADQLHARLLVEAGALAGLPPDAPGRATRRAALERLLDDEQVLRQRADGLYADAAAAVVTGLRIPQQNVMALTQAAAEKIRKITLISDAAGLVAGLLTLSGSIVTRQFSAVPAAIDTIRTQLQAVRADLPSKH